MSEMQHKYTFASVDFEECPHCKQKVVLRVRVLDVKDVQVGIKSCKACFDIKAEEYRSN